MDSSPRACHVRANSTTPSMLFTEVLSPEQSRLLTLSTCHKDSQPSTTRPVFRKASTACQPNVSSPLSPRHPQGPTRTMKGQVKHRVDNPSRIKLVTTQDSWSSLKKSGTKMRSLQWTKNNSADFALGWCDTSRQKDTTRFPIHNWFSLPWERSRQKLGTLTRTICLLWN